MREPSSKEEAVSVRRLDRVGMVMLRGDLEARKVTDALSMSGLGKVPDKVSFTSAQAGNIAWMSPDELLIFLPEENTLDCVGSLETTLEGFHCLVTDVSDMRAMFEVKGEAVRDVLAKELPIDLSPVDFSVGDFRRTRFGQVAVAVWLEDERTARVICRTSESEYVEALLKSSAEPHTIPGFFVHKHEAE